MSPASSSAALPLFVADVQIGLLVLVALAVGVVSYTVYRDAEARNMDHAAYWGAAVGLLFVLGFVVGGLLAVGAYVAVRPTEIEEPLIPERGNEAEESADAPVESSHDLTPARVQAASDMAVRGYARRIDGIDPTADPTDIRAQLLILGREDAEKRERLVEACNCVPCTCAPCACDEPESAVDDDTADGDTDEADRDGTNDGTADGDADEADCDGANDDADDSGGSSDANGPDNSDEADRSANPTGDTASEADSGSTDEDSPDERNAADSQPADAEARGDESDTKSADQPGTDADPDAGPDTFDGRGELHDGDPSMPTDDPEDASDGEDEV